MFLEPFLDAPQGSAAEHDTLRALIDGVTPVIEGVLRGRVGAASEREELFSEAMLRLIRRLHEIKSERPANPIENLSGYAAVTAFHVVHSHLRRTSPGTVALPSSPQTERADDSASIESSLVSRSALITVWREVQLLPARQRIALLLGLRDESDSAITSLLIILGIATFKELANALEMSADELTSIWDQLPLPDTAIAERLDVTRQQVINLRKSARERLQRKRRAGEARPHVQAL